MWILNMNMDSKTDGNHRSSVSVKNSHNLMGLPQRPLPSAPFWAAPIRSMLSLSKSLNLLFSSFIFLLDPSLASSSLVLIVFALYTPTSSLSRLPSMSPKGTYMRCSVMCTGGGIRILNVDVEARSLMIVDNLFDCSLETVVFGGLSTLAFVLHWARSYIAG